MKQLVKQQVLVGPVYVSMCIALFLFDFPKDNQLLNHRDILT